ncbi:MAG TPA: response regulator [Stellaceae bacterium]|nr:response regulator [Stellaceae bacterium]
MASLNRHRLTDFVRRRWSPQAITASWVFLVCLALAGIDLSQTYHSRSVALETAARNGSNVAQSVAEHADKTLQTVDAILVGVVAQVEAAAAGNVDAAPLRRLLAAQLGALPWISHLVVFDAAGTSSAGSLDVSASELDSFTFHQSHTDREAHVGLLRAGATPRWMILVSRRIETPDGGFAGAAVAAIDMSYMQQFYGTFDVGTGGAINLLLDTGILLVRHPADETRWFGKDLSAWSLFRKHLPISAAGTYEQPSPFDGDVRLLSYRHLAHYPLVTIAALDQTQALAGWRADARWHLTGIGILAVIAGLLGWRSAGQARQRLHAERATAAAIADYRLLADSSIDMVVRMSIDGLRLYVSPGSRHVLGYEPEELLREPIWKTFHPDDIADYQDFKRRLVAGSGSDTHAHRLRHKNGSYVWVEAVARLVPGASPEEAPTIVSAVRDISPRKRAEAQLMDAIESISDAFALWDDQWRFVMCNSRYREFYKMSSDYLVVGTPMYELLLAGAKVGQYGPTEDPEALTQEILQANADPSTTYERLLGDGRWILGCNRRTARGGWAGVRTDITVQKQRELELHQTKALLEQQAADLGRLADDLTEAKRAAEQASLVKSEFLANMSHEIRTPMNGIIGMNGLLMRTPLSADQQKFADNVRLSAEALLGIINDILDVSKLEAGKVGLEEIDFDLAELVEGVVELLSPRSQEKGLEIAAFLEDAARRPLRGDPTRLRQILMNLLSNAIKFTEKGSVAVEVKALQVEAGRTELQIEVSDTGMGVPDETKAKLFEKFEQADGSITRRFGGTGLGLHITRQLVELMGGHIGVLDRPTGGSVFWVELSLPNAAQPIPAPAGQHRDLSAVRALVVDDVAMNRSIFVRQLAAEGIVADNAEDGRTALAMLHAAMLADRPYDLLLIDQMMPEMAGEDVAEAIRAEAGRAEAGRTRARWPQPKLILASSIGTPARGDKAAIVGFDAFLTKPVRHAALVDCIDRVLDSPFEPKATKIPDSEISGSEISDSKVSGGHAAGGQDQLRNRSAHILLVEDNRINRVLASALLEEPGHRVTCAEDGLLALAAIEQDVFALVLMDVQMPNLDGLEATRRIRQMGGRHATVPIIAMTANAMEGDRQRCLDAGMDDYISKPIDVKVFTATIARWLDDARADAAAPAAKADEAPATVALPAIIDDEYLERLAAVMPSDRFSSLIGTYLDGARALLERLKTALTQEDLAALAHASHDLKSTSGNFGAKRLQGLAEQLEAACRAGDIVTSNRLVGVIEEASDDAWSVLRTRLAPPRARRKTAAS